jgi:predicted DNA-binding protein (UPF0251 family)
MLVTWVDEGVNPEDPMRPKKQRRIGCRPGARLFKPRGIPVRDLGLVCLEADELEALRLADQLGLHHAESGRRMGVSRATFGRILESARHKVATALVDGQAIELGSAGGPSLDSG